MISAVLIVRNEAANLEACLESIRPHVTELVIVDTGSTDASPEIAQRYADKFEVFTACNGPDGLIDDFSMARNRALSLATQPWIFWCDGDDVVIGAERLGAIAANLDARRGDGPAMALFPYDYAYDATGRVEMVHIRERLVTPKEAFQWQEPVHEVLAPIQPVAIVERTEAVRVQHRKGGKPAPEPHRNLRILRRHFERGGSSPRTLYYLALEYGNVGDLGQSIQLHRRYIDRSDWEDEKFLACIEVSRHYQTLGDYGASLEFAWKALQAREGWFQAYFQVGKAYYFLAQRGGPEERRNWERCAHYFELGLQMPPESTVLFIHPLDRSHNIHKYLNVAYNKLGNLEKALQSITTSLAAKPDADLEQNRVAYETHLARRDLERCLDVLGGHGRLTPEARQAALVAVDTVPAVPELAPAPDRPVAPGKLDIIVFVGESWEAWSPLSAKLTGIGGSETAVIEMTRRWAAYGHRVRVYADVEGEFEGVEYLRHERFRGSRCDILVSSRRPDAVDDGLCEARLRFVWVHDVHLGGGMTHARALRTDRFLALSEWHKGNILATHRQIHEGQIIVTRNGIDLGRFSQEVERDQYRCVYSSSPDRGLESLLQMWPRIRKCVPDATLEVFYGFKTWEAMARRFPPEQEKIIRIKAALRALGPQGVTFHGRQPQDVVARAMLSAGVWAYPTWFSETSCITAMEAQAAGLYVVTSPIAALKETCGDGTDFIEGDWLSPEYQEAFMTRVVERMLTPRDGSDRLAIQEDARRFDWDTLAKEWITMFETTKSGMPGYVGFAA